MATKRGNKSSKKKGQRDRSSTNRLKKREDLNASSKSKTPKGGKKKGLFGKVKQSGKKNNTLALENTTSGSSAVTYGDVVELLDGRLGTIRYIGSPVKSQSEVWLGLSLAEPSGKNDGSQRGVRYWKDKPKHGMFAKPAKVKKIVKSCVKIIYNCYILLLLFYFTIIPLLFFFISLSNMRVLYVHV